MTEKLLIRRLKRHFNPTHLDSDLNKLLKKIIMREET